MSLMTGKSCRGVSGLTRPVHTAALALVALLALPGLLEAQFRYEVVEGFAAAAIVPGVGAELIQGTDGALYGTRASEAFRLEASGRLTVLHRFTVSEGRNPNRLIQAADGNFYGTTSSGGTLGPVPAYGTVFRMDTAGQVTVLHRFTGADGASSVAALLEASDGSLYGTTAFGGASFVDSTRLGFGTVFRIGLDGSFTTLHSFNGACRLGMNCDLLNGANPRTELMQGADGQFYGTASADGDSFGGPTLFRISATGTLTTLYNFSRARPSGPLLQAADGRFYGTAISTDGGASSGTPGYTFVIEPGRGLDVIHGFNDGTNPLGRLVETPDGSILGATRSNAYFPTIRGAIYKVDPARRFTTLHTFSGADGANPMTGLTAGNDGRFYGSTLVGGRGFTPDPTGESGGYGTVFAIDAAGAFGTVYSFDSPGGSGRGADPRDGLTEGMDGALYGTTERGGLGGGTLYRIDGDTLTTVYRFPINNPGGDGSLPRGELLQGSDGRFYGVTTNFGASGYGTAYAVDAAGALITLHHFTAAEGRPALGLTPGSDGRFYGTTSSSIFRMDLSGVVTTLHTFVTGTSVAASPQPLTETASGSFFGTTAADGPLGYGTVFTMDPAGTVTTLHAFAGRDGSHPAGPLMRAADGSVYGTTSRGGASFGNPVEPAGYGTVFRIDPEGTVSTIHHFSGIEGANPRGGLLQARDGFFYGTTQAGGFGSGTIFRMDAAGALTTLHTLVAETDGAWPSGRLLQARDGTIYGITQRSGPGGAGTIFRLVPASDMPTASLIPGHIEAEDYDQGGPGIGYSDSTAGNEGGALRADDVDIKPSQEGGFAVGWMAAGEWLAYTADVQRDGLFSIVARLGSALPGRTFRVEVDGRDVTGLVAVPLVTDWDHYGTVTLTNIALRAGPQVLRFIVGPADDLDFQGFAVVAQAGSGSIPAGSMTSTMTSIDVPASAP